MGTMEDGLLLREHAHRVANDMAVAVAALRVADRRVGGDPLITSAVLRLDAASQVQRLLCERPACVSVDLGARLRELCAVMPLAHAGPPPELEVVAPVAFLAVDDAWLVLLCVHELVGNALRHGRRRGARVRVELSVDGAVATLSVRDANAPRVWSRSGGQGAAIVDQLAARLGGTVARSCGADGGTVRIAMPGLLVAVPGVLEAA